MTLSTLVRVWKKMGQGQGCVHGCQGDGASGGGTQKEPPPGLLRKAQGRLGGLHTVVHGLWAVAGEGVLTGLQGGSRLLWGGAQPP